MTQEIYSYIFYAGAALAGVMLIASVILFFVYKIPTVIGDLTGTNKKRAIEHIRNKNLDNEFYKTRRTNHKHRNLTNKTLLSNNLINKRANVSRHSGISTEKNGSISSVSSFAGETTILSSGETTILNSNETTVLSNTIVAMSIQEDRSSTFQIEYEITFIHTNEVI